MPDIEEFRNQLREAFPCLDGAPDVFFDVLADPNATVEGHVYFESATGEIEFTPEDECAN